MVWDWIHSPWLILSQSICRIKCDRIKVPSECSSLFTRWHWAWLCLSTVSDWLFYFRVMHKKCPTHMGLQDIKWVQLSLQIFWAYFLNKLFCLLSHAWQTKCVTHHRRFIIIQSKEMIINGCLTWKYISYVIIFRVTEHKTHIQKPKYNWIWGRCNNWVMEALHMRCRWWCNVQ